jgi:hypothetical protein
LARGYGHLNDPGETEEKRKKIQPTLAVTQSRAKLIQGFWSACDAPNGADESTRNTPLYREGRARRGLAPGNWALTMHAGAPAP